MVSISDITNHILVQCPKCRTGQFLYKWGQIECKYLGEDGNTPCGNIWTVDYDAELLLSEAKKKIEQTRQSPRESNPREMKLQAINGGWIGVLQ